MDHDPTQSARPGDAPASRARGKLEAALDAFGLRARLEGALALDVGAGAGGFVEALLDAGARRVVAIDVGSGQLRPHLLTDPRVESMEGVDFRRLPPRLVAGPFDFFSVDVSFAAGRNVLRGLALRLRPGSEGVLLIKPQFELSPRAWSERGADPEALRRRAIERVRSKAQRLGFRILATGDSPVPGRAGTVEVLAHLEFLGMPERTARETPAVEPRGAASAAPGLESLGPDTPLSWFAVVAPGGETVAEREIRRLEGVSGVRSVPGGVEFRGTLDVGWRANLWLRTPTRVVLRVGEFRARDFGMLRRRTARLPWDRFVAEGASLAVSVTQSRSRLYHTGAIAENVLLGLSEALGRDVSLDAAETSQLVLVRGDSDCWTFSLDASGERLHRRGWRIDTGAASLRETLASIVLGLCEWRTDEPLVDGYCGVGTFAIEAALAAQGRAPGAERAFACEAWRCAQREDWARERESARRAAPCASLPEIQAIDRDPHAIEAAQRNAVRASCERAIGFTCGSFESVTVPARPGLVILNPPYGVRMGRKRELVGLYTELGRVLRARFAGWRAGVLVADRALDSALRLRVLERHRLRNGGLDVTLLVARL